MITGTTQLGENLVVTVDHDPAATATDVLAGALIIYGSTYYKKLTSGSNTDVAMLSAVGSFVMAESAGTSSTTQTTYQTKVSLTVSVPGTYLLMYCAEVASDKTNKAVSARFYDGTTTHGEVNSYPNNTMNYIQFSGNTVLTIASSTTFLVQYLITGAATASIKNARIVAIRSA